MKNIAKRFTHPTDMLGMLPIDSLSWLKIGNKLIPNILILYMVLDIKYKRRYETNTQLKI